MTWRPAMGAMSLGKGERMSVVVVATILPLPEHRAAVIDAIKETVEQVHAEDGCELYSLNEAPDRLIMVEKWASRQALDAHAKGPNLAALGSRLADKVAAAPEVITLDPVPAGDPAKGTV
jgi:quinol monooxygenase YgiN